jgi:glutamate decarboxylase
VETYLDYLTQKIVSHSIHTSSPKYVGHMTSALPYFTRPLGKLMTAMNQNLVKTETSKAFTPYERQALGMIHRLIYGAPESFYNYHIQNGDSTLGMVVSGGTIANITALWCARNSLLGPAGEFAGIEQEGAAAALKYYSYEDVVIIGSSLMHFSLDKAADVLGIGRRNLLKIPNDANNRIDLCELKRTIEECTKSKRRVLAIVGIAGATDCGSVDPLPQLAEIARSIGAHFHVDAAWGGPLLFSNIHRHKLDGIDQADSVTIDGHKQLYLPVGIGMVVFKDPRLAKVIEKQAKYVVRAGSIDLGKRSLEASRPGMVLFLHAALHLIGRKGYEYLIDEGIRKTHHLADSISSRPEFELLTQPEMNILLYRYIPRHLRSKAGASQLTAVENDSINRLNERLQKAQRRAGHTFVSRTTLSNINRYAGMPL